jgi:hypothetical protein
MPLGRPRLPSVNFLDSWIFIFFLAFAPFSGYAQTSCENQFRAFAEVESSQYTYQLKTVLNWLKQTSNTQNQSFEQRRVEQIRNIENLLSLNSQKYGDVVKAVLNSLAIYHRVWGNLITQVKPAKVEVISSDSSSLTLQIDRTLRIHGSIRTTSKTYVITKEKPLKFEPLLTPAENPFKFFLPKIEAQTL